MLQIKFAPKPESEAQAERFWAHLQTLPDLCAPIVYREIWDVYVMCVTREFADEGYSHEWPALAENTLRFRKYFGYEDKSILTREEYLLRSVTQEDMGPEQGFVKEAINPDEWREIETGNTLNYTHFEEGIHIYQFGTLDERYDELSQRWPMMPSEEVWEAEVAKVRRTTLTIAVQTATRFEG